MKAIIGFRNYYKSVNRMISRLSKCPLVQRDRTLVAVNPVLEKNIFTAADVAGVQRYFNGSCFSKGNRTALLRH